MKLTMVVGLTMELTMVGLFPTGTGFGVGLHPTGAPASAPVVGKRPASHF
jgi:hypothetical protein